MDDHSTTTEEEDVEVFVDPTEHLTEPSNKEENKSHVSKMTTNSMMESKSGR
jgi:hypothetical protein